VVFRLALLSVLFVALDIGAVAGIYFALPDTKKLTQGILLERKTSDGKPFMFMAGPKNRKYVTLDQIPKHFRDAVLALEDARFYQHYGFDWNQIQKVLLNSEDRKRLRGASTISQQLIKNLYLSNERSLRRKFIEALITIKLELTVSKDRIMELYLNSIDWGRGIFGIADATSHYFRKAPSALSLKEAVFLAAIIPNPIRFGKFTEDKLPKKFVRTQMMRALREMYSAGTLSFLDFQEVMERPYEFEGDN
jgi:penicillin-binding protein 1A